MITSSLSCRNLVSFYLLKRSSPLLRLQTLRRLNSVFSRAAREAELEPGNARKQAEYFKQLYDKRDYSKIIQRFEENADKLALDSNSIRIYVEALNRTGQGNRALEHVFKGVQARQDFMPSGHYGELKEGRNNEQLLQRILKIAEQNGRDRSVMSEPLIEPPHASNQGTKENPVYVVSRNPPLSNKDRFWSAIKLTAGIWFALAVYATFSEEISRMNGGRSFSVMKENVPEAPSHFTFADVQGVDEAKEELLEIVEFLKDPHKFTKLGGKLPKGVLLTGPPGTGKTLLARAVAGEASVPFFLCSGSEFDEMFVGVGAKRVRELFAAAKKNSPCIVFIDEIDAVGSMRNPRDQQYAKMTLNQLLVEMDGFSQTEGIIVIGATNFPESLDKALVRPGRFDRNVTVSLPDVKGRQEILKVHTKNVPLANDVRLGLIARATPGFSGADLFNLINYAAVRAASFDQNNVTMTDLEWARDRILMGAERKSAAISERSKRLTAFHESGHAIMAVYTPGATPIHKATIMPRGQALGMVSQVPDDDEFEWNKKQMLARIDVAMGGRVAEELIFGEDDITSGASSDIEQATKIAKAMISRFGMGSDQVGKVLWEKDYEELSSETRQKIENEVRETIEDSYLRAKTLLTKKRKELDLLANALLEYETLSKDEIEKVIKGLKLDRPIVSDKE